MLQTWSLAPIPNGLDVLKLKRTGHGVVIVSNLFDGVEAGKRLQAAGYRMDSNRRVFLRGDSTITIRVTSYGLEALAAGSWDYAVFTCPVDPRYEREVLRRLRMAPADLARVTLDEVVRDVGIEAVDRLLATYRPKEAPQVLDARALRLKAEANNQIGVAFEILKYEHELAELAA